MASRNIPRLFVGNVPWTVGRKELREYFMQFGQVQHTHIFFDKSTGMSRMFGFVQFASRDGYVNSMGQHDHHLEGNRLTVADVHVNNSNARQNVEIPRPVGTGRVVPGAAPSEGAMGL